MNWISVKDMLPGRNHIVVVLRLWLPEYREEQFCLGYLDETDGIDADSPRWMAIPHSDFDMFESDYPKPPAALFGQDARENVEVTHWMPLPDEPKD